MRRAFTLVATALILALLPLTALAGEAAHSHASGAAATAAASPAAASPAPAALPGAGVATPSGDPLLTLLVSKGILSQSEADSLRGATSLEMRNRLALLLRDKGVLSSDDLKALAITPAPASAGASAMVVATGAAAPKADPGPAVIPAVAPVRVLQVDPPKKQGLIPVIRIGDNIRIAPYGFYKSTVVYDSSSPYGNDFPLPGFIGDINGPDAFPEFHLKARSLRLGSNFEWNDLSPNLTLTGKFELDFEGNFSRSNNRNISTIRSNAPQIRLGYGRVDYKVNDKTTLFALFGQDWTPFGSSTLPNLLETTGFGIAFGTLYERAPQFRFGANIKTDWPRKLTFEPEVAVVLPAFGNLPTDLGNQLGFGERQGTDSGRPEIQGRLVTQWQLDTAPGVAPAQFIVSGMQGDRSAVVLAAAVPAAFKAAFPTGFREDTSRYGYTAELQLPTRYVTITTKYYNGEDLRFYFAGQLFAEFNDTTGFTGTATAGTVDGASTLVFGTHNGIPSVAKQRAPRSQGGFFNVGIPLSRIAGADPTGRNAGWVLYLHYGYDQVLARDVRRLGGGRAKGDLIAGQLQYKLNQYLTFAAEESVYQTRALPLNATGNFPLFQGVPTHEQDDFRSEVGTIFTF